MLAHVVRVLFAGGSFDCTTDQGVALRGIVKVCSRLSNQRIVRKKLQAAFDSIFKVTRVAHFGVAVRASRTTLSAFAIFLPKTGSFTPGWTSKTIRSTSLSSRTPLSQTAAAFSALEADGSWALVSRCFQPAVLQFSRDGETLDAFGLVNDLLIGTLSPEDWVQKCLHLGIAEETLGVVKAQTIPTAPSA